LYFNWNPTNALDDSLYTITTSNTQPSLISLKEQRSLPSRYGSYNEERTQMVFVRSGDLYLYDVAAKTTRQLTSTQAYEGSPSFNAKGTHIVFEQGNNLYTMALNNGFVTQLTNFVSKPPKKAKKGSKAANWLKADQNIFEVLEQEDLEDSLTDAMEAKVAPSKLLSIYTQGGSVFNLSLSPNERFVAFKLYFSADGKNTMVPDFITRSGYTEDLNARSKVGDAQATSKMGIFDRQKDTVYYVDPSTLPGIQDLPAYYSEYDRKEEAKDRPVHVFGPKYAPSGQKALFDIRSHDHKDRWIVLYDLAANSMKVLERQHNDAWVAGPGIGWSAYANGAVIGWMPDGQHAYFQSENSGYSHLTVANTKNGKVTDLTPGNFEVYEPSIGPDKKYWYFTANREHSGVRHYYRMKLGTKPGKIEKLTSMEGNNDVTLSPDGQWLAIRYSNANTPWELYLQKNTPRAKAQRITNGASALFKSYQWRKPEFVTFKAADGANVPARLYKPENATNNGPAVIFVHGAGYLQNAHKWWSSYFREYMFHNMLVDNGYTVLDIDYRGSAGYGSDWRTGIYRHMGGKDLSDHIDGAKWLVQNHGVAADRIGIYGGSYGGFITLMALFTSPETFAAGAALRAVTDWAHYNHPYTSNILNTPVNDPKAYRQSSPIYFAENLNKPLLICHGMVDTNVQMQDVVRLAQRLIELGKDDWEFAVFPVESHGFTEPSSWTDEYKRIFKLFEVHLK